MPLIADTLYQVSTATAYDMGGFRKGRNTDGFPA
jgi:hypothetical protein